MTPTPPPSAPAVTPPGTPNHPRPMTAPLTRPAPSWMTNRRPYQLCSSPGTGGVTRGSLVSGTLPSSGERKGGWGTGEQLDVVAGAAGDEPHRATLSHRAHRPDQLPAGVLSARSSSIARVSAASKGCGGWRTGAAPDGSVTVVAVRRPSTSGRATPGVHWRDEPEPQRREPRRQQRHRDLRPRPPADRDAPCGRASRRRRGRRGRRSGPRGPRSPARRGAAAR